MELKSDFILKSLVNDGFTRLLRVYTEGGSILENDYAKQIMLLHNPNILEFQATENQ